MIFKPLNFLILISLLFFSCNSDDNYGEELKEIAVGVNQKCPQMLDSETRLDGIEIIEPNTINYKYTLVHVEAQNVDTQQFNRALWPGLVSNTKVSADMKKLRDHNTTLLYSYRDKFNKPISTVTISPQHYK